MIMLSACSMLENQPSEEPATKHTQLERESTFIEPIEVIEEEEAAVHTNQAVE